MNDRMNERTIERTSEWMSYSVSQPVVKTDFLERALNTDIRLDESPRFVKVKYDEQF